MESKPNDSIDLFTDRMDQVRNGEESAISKGSGATAPPKPLIKRFGQIKEDASKQKLDLILKTSCHPKEKQRDCQCERL